MSELTPESIFNSYKNDKIDKVSAVNYLRSFIENSNNEILRVNCIRIIGRMNLNYGEIYKFLEELFVSDFSDNVKQSVGEIIIRDFFDEGKKLFKWHIESTELAPVSIRVLQNLRENDNNRYKILYNFIKNELAKKYSSEFNIELSEASGLAISFRRLKLSGEDFLR